MKRTRRTSAVDVLARPSAYLRRQSTRRRDMVWTGGCKGMFQIQVPRCCTPRVAREQAMWNVGPAGVGLAIFTQTFDRAGTPLSSQELDGTRVTWAYDVVNQLNHEQRSGVNGYNVTYIYGLRRNRSIKNDSGQISTYVYDNANQLALLTPPSGQPTTSSYDANGNLTVENTGGSRTSYTWDGENRLTGVVYADGTRDTFSYDASGMRQKKVTSAGTMQFVWDAQNVLQEKDANGSDVGSVLWGPSVVARFAQPEARSKQQFFRV